MINGETIDLLSFNDVNMLQIDNNGPTTRDKRGNASKLKLKNFMVEDPRLWFTLVD